MNELIIQQLEVLENHAELLGEYYKKAHYRKAIQEIEKLTFAITSDNLKQAHDQVHIGKKIWEKIEYYVLYHIMPGLIEAQKLLTCKSNLGDILGIGAIKLGELCHKNIDSFEKLQKAADNETIKLTHLQKCGIKYYRDLHVRIPRSEVELIVNDIVQILQLDDYTICGSYRRMSTTSGDIDILICSNKMENILALLNKENSFITCLAQGNEKLTFLWRSVYSKLVRQIDIVIVCKTSCAAALLYFTGSWEFNSAIRAHAKQKGYRLNQHGLYKNTGVQIITTTEKDIFDKLQLQYVAPENRVNHTSLIHIKK